MSKQTRDIPRSAAPFFQEYSFESLDPEKHQALVDERILAFGNRQETRWLFSRYGKSAIRKWLQEDGCFKLSHRRYNFFCIVLDLEPILHPRIKRRIWPH